MVKKILTSLLIINSLSFAQSNFNPNKKTQFHGGIQAGLFNGFGTNLSLMISNFAEDFPFCVNLNFGLSFLDAGNPNLARKIFINDNTNGAPEKSGKAYNFGVDFLYKSRFLGLKRNYFYAGPRYSMFTGTFDFVDGNEVFDINSDQWGLGIGMENYFRIVPAIDLVLNFGFDYYFSGDIYGHDTSYSPDGQSVNPRLDYSYSDADKAINQPKYQAKAMLGFNFSL